MQLEFPAICCTQNSQSFFITVLPSDVLIKTCYVSRRNENSFKGFQRLLSASRAKNIAKYLDASKDVIPSAIILSAGENAHFSFNKEHGKIQFDESERSMLVIDGQHRIYGFMEAKNIYQIPVIIFSKLNLESEVKLFIDINTTQKSVPTALLTDMKSIAGKNVSVEQRQSILFAKLDDDSVLSGYLLANQSKGGKISRSVFNNATRHIFEASFFEGYSDEVIYRTMRNYLQALKHTFDKSGNVDAKIWKAVFFKAAMNLFVDVCEKVIEKYKDLKAESFEEYLSPLRDLNFSEYSKASNGSVSKMTVEMKKLLQSSIVLSEDMF